MGSQKASSCEIQTTEPDTCIQWCHVVVKSTILQSQKSPGWSHSRHFQWGYLGQLLRVTGDELVDSS